MPNFQATIIYEFEASSEAEAHEVAYQIAWAGNAYAAGDEIDDVRLNEDIDEPNEEEPTVCDNCQDDIDDEQYTIGEGLCEDCSAAQDAEEDEGQEPTLDESLSSAGLT